MNDEQLKIHNAQHNRFMIANGWSRKPIRDAWGEKWIGYTRQAGNVTLYVFSTELDKWNWLIVGVSLMCGGWDRTCEGAECEMRRVLADGPRGKGGAK